MPAGEPILFPCLIAIGGSLSLTTKKGTERFWIKAHLGENRFLMTHGVSERLKISFFVDRTGAFREVRDLRIRRRWTKPIAWFHDFALRECEICPGIRVSVSELLGRMAPLKAGHPSSTRQVRQFLRKLPGDAPFNEGRFRELWDKCGYALPPDEWQARLP
jgi:hypothetical protein